MDYSKMKTEISAFFKDYENFFNNALSEKNNVSRFSEFYAEEFIAASPEGAITGKNDNQLVETINQGFEFYRHIDTTKMTCIEVSITKLNDIHAIAHTKWNASYHREESMISIPFESHYLMQFRNFKPVIFGWITGNESLLLDEYGII